MRRGHRWWATGFLLLALTVWALTPGPADAGAARTGGTLKVAVPSNLNTLDPAKQKIGEEYIYSFLVFNGLTLIDRDMSLKPDLAEKWEHSKDLKTWTFSLRPNVKFANGDPFTAKSVQFTFERMMDQATAAPSRCATGSTRSSRGTTSRTPTCPRSGTPSSKARCGRFWRSGRPSAHHRGAHAENASSSLARHASIGSPRS